jgi:hypothetical protein
MDFCLAVDSDAVFEPSIGFRNDGSKAPSFGGFDLFDEVDAVRVVGSVEKSAEWFDGGYRKSPLEKTLSKRGYHRGHQGAKLLIPKVAG